MARRFRAKRYLQEEEPTVNLTPLIDVVFVILILFILVAPMLEIDRIELADAGKESKSTALKEQSLISLHVLADSQIILNNEKLSLTALKTKLQNLKNNNPSCTPQVYFDKKAPFGTYQTVKNCVEEAGFESMDIVLKP